MDHLAFVIILIAVVLCCAYSLLIASYCYGWVRIRTELVSTTGSVFVSVIIAARNEENNILNCLTAILHQNYPRQQFEVIIVDDASTDLTNKKVQQFCELHDNFRLITLTDAQQTTGKKNAIRTAIDTAKGELIVTTDADCIMGVNWLSTLVAFYEQSQAKMIVAPVSFYEEKTVFEKMQSLEFMALIASAGASLHFNKAVLCNGANLIYSKTVFYEVNGFEGIDARPSGDDVLLMYKVKQRYPDGVRFLKNRDAIVYTKAKSSLKEFIDQRKRWASKGLKALNAETKYVSLTVYLFNLILLILPVFFFFCLENSAFRLAFIKIGLILIGIKGFIDFLLLFLAASFFKKKKLLLYFLPEQLIYILYVVVVGLLGIKGKYKWKGRNINLNG